jgi:putative addiction module killer protein
MCGKRRSEEAGTGNATFGMKETEKEGRPARNGKIYATMGMMVEIREYRESDGHSPFGEWRGGLDVPARQRVTTAVLRIGLGNFSNVKGVGGGIFEYRISFGPGYRVYFGKDGEEIVILLGGGTKKRQENDIRIALGRWEDYKQRKKQRKEKE